MRVICRNDSCGCPVYCVSEQINGQWYVLSVDLMECVEGTNYWSVSLILGASRSEKRMLQQGEPQAKGEATYTRTRQADLSGLRWALKALAGCIVAIRRNHGVGFIDAMGRDDHRQKAYGFLKRYGFWEHVEPDGSRMWRRQI